MEVDDVSKKKRRYSKHRKQKAVLVGRNCHHICYIKKSWSSGYAKALREFWYCQIMMDINEHNDIHKRIYTMPPPSDANAKAALGQLRELDKRGVLHETDSLQKRVELIASLFDCVEQKTANALRRQL